MGNKFPQELQIVIDIVKGGFVLSYPSKETIDGYHYMSREVFSSARKMNQKIKEVLEYSSTTPADTGETE